MEEQLLISDLAKLSGVKPGMIRYFEKLGLITPSIRTPSGYRVFSPHHVKELQFVRKMYDLGFYAQHIKKLRGIKSSDLSIEEKKEAIKEAFEDHAEYIKERIKHFQGLYERVEEAALTFVDEVLKDC